MFILENPYVSTLMIETLEKNQFEVLRNSVAQSFSKSFNFVNEIRGEKVYSNSENAIGLVKNNPYLEKLIYTSKNKVEFRKRLKSVYPKFFFKEIPFTDLENLDISEFPEQFIIKPSIGFLSMGVHKVSNHAMFDEVVLRIKTEVNGFAKHFPDKVLSSSNFIVEEIIQGDEFAVDAYYNELGEPVILNIFQHPFASEDDVSDRVYISSKEIIENNLNYFYKTLVDIGKTLDMRNFPMHIEFIKRNDGDVVPVEINPMRFAGWCTTDLAYYAYGINVYEYFQNSLKPDWKQILEGKDGRIYYFAMAETPQNIDKNKIKFDYDIFKKNFSNILDFREINYKEKPLFAIIFGETRNMKEINNILQLNVKDYYFNIT